MTIVRALEWDEPRCGPDEYKTIGKADALGFYYILERRYMSDRFTVTRSSDIQPFAWQESPDAAKAAAQADYEARILSALTPAADLFSENERLRTAHDDGVKFGIALSIAFLLRDRDESVIAEEWWDATGMTIEACERIGLDEYDLDPIRAALERT